MKNRVPKPAAICISAKRGEKTSIRQRKNHEVRDAVRRLEHAIGNATFVRSGEIATCGKRFGKSMVISPVGLRWKFDRSLFPQLTGAAVQQIQKKTISCAAEWRLARPSDHRHCRGIRGDGKPVYVLVRKRATRAWRLRRVHRNPIQLRRGSIDPASQCRAASLRAPGIDSQPPGRQSDPQLSRAGPRSCVLQWNTSTGTPFGRSSFCSNRT